ncbi:Alpha/Beta hydrolase protein [Achaetomium macrosporum]|uniref:Alpha/Beta hydrolase protein n=1 Tax=Achaetomium macrosporum TaxID=79813 RepID=A0AAN7C983_9PEZI|nr:Alpha/Beta hydrolase protein [Achaetomium macrosporum]
MAATLQPHPAQKPHSIHEYAGLARPPHLTRLESATHKRGHVESLSIEVDDDAQGGFVPGFLHLPPDFVNTSTTTTTSSPGTSTSTQPGTTDERPPTALPPHHHRTAAILLSGAGGGVVGPSSIYLSLACKLATLGRGIPALRLDYRFPARTEPCCRDVRAAMAYLNDMYGLDRFVLIGWSFGGAVVYTVGGDDPRVVGCATVASQTANAEQGMKKMRPRPVMLLHGSGDNTLCVGCSQRLYHVYGAGDRTLHVFEGDNHSLSHHAEEAEEMLCEFVARCAGVRVGPEERRDVVGAELVEDGERHELMERGGDLRAPERED